MKRTDEFIKALGELLDKFSDLPLLNSKKLVKL